MSRISATVYMKRFDRGPFDGLDVTGADVWTLTTVHTHVGLLVSESALIQMVP